MWQVVAFLPLFSVIYNLRSTFDTRFMPRKRTVCCTCCTRVICCTPGQYRIQRYKFSRSCLSLSLYNLLKSLLSRLLHHELRSLCLLLRHLVSNRTQCCHARFNLTCKGINPWSPVSLAGKSQVVHIANVFVEKILRQTRNIFGIYSEVCEITAHWKALSKLLQLAESNANSIS